MKAWFWFLMGLILLGCGSRPVAPTTDRIQGNVRETLSPLKERLLRLALQEWDYFGRQQVIYRDTEESIPHVGVWEDDDLARSKRVNLLLARGGTIGPQREGLPATVVGGLHQLAHDRGRCASRGFPACRRTLGLCQLSDTPPSL